MKKPTIKDQTKFLCQTFKKVRNDLGMSLEEAALLIEDVAEESFSRQSLWMIENGKQDIYLRQAISICIAYGLPLEDVFTQRFNTEEVATYRDVINKQVRSDLKKVIDSL